MAEKVLLRTRFRALVGKSEVGLPRFPEKREEILYQAKALVGQINQNNPHAQLSREDVGENSIAANNFARPDTLANNVHAEHNLRHAQTVRVIAQYAANYVEGENRYQERLGHVGRPLDKTAIAVAAEVHDMKRKGDYVESVVPVLLKIHGRKVAEDIYSKKLFPDLDPFTRQLAAAICEYHDVDTRLPSNRQPEEELIAVIDRGELARLIYGVGPVAVGGRLAWNYFARRRDAYQPYYFPGLVETFQPIFKAMLLLGIENMNQGYNQQESVLRAAEELGIIKPPVQVGPSTSGRRGNLSS